MAGFASALTIWEMGALLLMSANAAGLAMQLIVHRFVPRVTRRLNSDLSAAVFAVIGVTYAVLLSFVAMSAWERFSAAEALTRQEADLLAFVHDVGSTLPDARRERLDADLLAYLREVVEVDWPAQVSGEAPPATDRALRRLEADLLGDAGSDAAFAAIRAPMVDILRQISGERRARRAYDQNTVPGLVWVILVIGGALTVASSHLLGGRRSGLHMMMTTAALVSSGALVLVLVLGLSSPYRGAFALSPEPYRAVLREIGG